MSFGAGQGADPAQDEVREHMRRGLQAQQDAFQQQDALLDDVHDAVLRIGGVSSNINEELGTHLGLLGDLEDGMDGANTLVGSITSKARNAVDLAGGPQYTCLICSLFGTLVFLIVYALLFKQ